MSTVAHTHLLVIWNHGEDEAHRVLAKVPGAATIASCPGCTNPPPAPAPKQQTFTLLSDADVQALEGSEDARFQVLNGLQWKIAPLKEGVRVSTAPPPPGAPAPPPRHLLTVWEVDEAKADEAARRGMEIASCGNCPNPPPSPKKSSFIVLEEDGVAPAETWAGDNVPADAWQIAPLTGSVVFTVDAPASMEGSAAPPPATTAPAPTPGDDSPPIDTTSRRPAFIVTIGGGDPEQPPLPEDRVTARGGAVILSCGRCANPSVADADADPGPATGVGLFVLAFPSPAAYDAWRSEAVVKTFLRGRTSRGGMGRV
jgi:hypothetical protein